MAKGQKLGIILALGDPLVTVAAASNGMGKGIPVRVLFDSGSQRSYVAESLKNRHGLQPTGCPKKSIPIWSTLATRM